MTFGRNGLEKLKPVSSTQAGYRTGVCVSVGPSARFRSAYEYGNENVYVTGFQEICKFVIDQASSPKQTRGLAIFGWTDYKRSIGLVLIGLSVAPLCLT